MATIGSTASKSVGQLGELLQEQQEPFILDVYLSERGCAGKHNLTSGANFICCRGDLGKFLKKSGSDQNKSKKCIPNIRTVLKVVCNKLFAIKGLRNKKSIDDYDEKPSRVTEIDRNNQETHTESDRFSSASSTTVYNSCSDGDIDERSSFADNSKSNLKLYHEREIKMQSLNGVS